jgi:hypothetical protein
MYLLHSTRLLANPIGIELQGSIEKVICEPDYTVKETGEIITLTHNWQYVDPDIVKQFSSHQQRISQLKTKAESIESSLFYYTKTKSMKLQRQNAIK